MGEAEKGLTSVIGVELSLSDGVLVREHSQSIKSLSWFNTWHHWSVLLEVLSEVTDIVDEDVDTVDQLLLKVGLLGLEVVSN